MSARPRKKQYRAMPDYLYFDKTAGKYILVLINGRKKTIGEDRAYSIAVAKEYNSRMRPESLVSVDNLVRESGGIHGESESFADHIDRLSARIKEDCKYSKSTLDTWSNDIIRAKEFFAGVYASDICLDTVNDYLNKYHQNVSANVQNRKVAFLKQLFDYAIDESLMFENPAVRKLRRRKEEKKRRRLSLDDFLRMRESAEPWLRTAMDLSMQTTHARLEITRIKYSIPEPKEGVCGCVWYKTPENGIYGILYIHRKKVEKHEASHVAIPIGEVLKKIIDDSRDLIFSPYIVHRRRSRANKMSQEVDHVTQVSPDYLTRAFSKLRDKLGVDKNYTEDEKTSFHEIRSLSAFLFSKQGVNPQSRMAHTDAESTKIYTIGHVEWVEVPHAEINVG